MIWLALAMVLALIRLVMGTPEVDGLFLAAVLLAAVGVWTLQRE